ncbi:MAG TPA: VWA domain-containing protein [bacterium]|nr:VWA domain-containing protein [bacterium]
MKFKHLMYSRKLTQWLGLVMLTCLIAYGAQAKIWPDPKITNCPVGANCITPTTVTPPVATWQKSGPVQAKAQLSQYKVLQGSDGMIYLKVDLEALDNDLINNTSRKPTDFVVVLDRSGSMSEKNKIEYARKAVTALLGQLKPEDRFSLVSFDTIVENPIPLTKVSSANLETLTTLDNSIAPRDSTNLEGGLTRGMDILKELGKTSGNARRMILVSDGLANVGLSDTPALSRIADGAVPGEFVISTIGVGLDFNENLLSALADHGTGSYYYLENPSGIDKVLLAEFFNASSILAKNLKLTFDLAGGFDIVDASGYPVTVDGRVKIVQPGHLYDQQKRTMYVSIKAPTNTIYAEALGQITLSYEINNTTHQLKLIDSNVMISCLPQEKRDEVLASIDKETFSKAWTQNNVGYFMKDSAKKINKGEYNQAKAGLKEFKDRLVNAYSAAPTPAMKQQIDDLDKMETQMEAGIASGATKSLSKDMQYKGIEKQRN